RPIRSRRGGLCAASATSRNRVGGGRETLCRQSDHRPTGSSGTKGRGGRQCSGLFLRASGSSRGALDMVSVAPGRPDQEAIHSTVSRPMRGLIESLASPRPIGAELPAAFQEDDFCQRMMTAFDEVLAPLFTTLDCLDSYLDPRLAPDDFVD